MVKTFVEFLENKGEEAQFILTEKKWIQNAINPDHRGYCSPMTKSTCTPKRKALAKRFKSGGDLHKEE